MGSSGVIGYDKSTICTGLSNISSCRQFIQGSLAKRPTGRLKRESHAVEVSNTLQWQDIRIRGPCGMNLGLKLVEAGS